MNPMEQNTISMTARESAFYNLGITLGGAQGVERAAAMVAGAGQQLRTWPSAQQLHEWLTTIAKQVVESPSVLGDLRAHSGSLEKVAQQVLVAQNGVADWVAEVATKLDHDAKTQRAQFTELLAALGSNKAQQAPASASRPVARPRGSLLARLGRRVIVELHQAIQDGRL